MARRAPARDSNVRSISSSRHWTRTWISTSSGMRSSSMMWRWKSKSGWEADGKPDLDLLEADVDQGVEQRQLALRVHRVDEGLVAVAQVDAGPTRRPGELAVRPGAIVEHQGHVRAVLAEGHGGRGHRAGPGELPAGRGRSPLLLSSCSLAHVLLPFVVRLRSDTQWRPAQQKTSWPSRHRRLRANAMWRSPSGKQQDGGDVVRHSADDCPITPRQRQGREDPRGITGRHGAYQPGVTEWANRI